MAVENSVFGRGEVSKGIDVLKKETYHFHITDYKGANFKIQEFQRNMF